MFFEPLLTCASTSCRRHARAELRRGEIADVHDLHHRSVGLPVGPWQVAHTDANTCAPSFALPADLRCRRRARRRAGWPSRPRCATRAWYRQRMSRVTLLLLIVAAVWRRTDSAGQRLQGRREGEAMEEGQESQVGRQGRGQGRWRSLVCRERPRGVVHRQPVANGELDLRLEISRPAMTSARTSISRWRSSIRATA